MYTFSLTLHNQQNSYSSQNFEADIVKEGINLATVFINYVERHQSTANVVVECLKGQRVWAQCNVNYGCDISNFNEYYYNFFSGFLIYSYE